MENIFTKSIIQNGEITISSFLILTAMSILIGCMIGFVYSRKNNASRSFIISLAMLPAIVQTVIMLVNGNVGAGVAVAGAFSLVRFRSAAGNSQEITNVFLAMAAGLATGMGYIGVAVLFSVIAVCAGYILDAFVFPGDKSEVRELRITIPEILDFDELFDDLLSKYTRSYSLEQVKTSNMGSLYKLEYKVVLNKDTKLKMFFDEIRERNGNLEVSCGRPVTYITEL